MESSSYYETCECCKVKECARFSFSNGGSYCMDCEDYNWGERKTWVPRPGGKKYMLKNEGSK